MKKLSFQTLFIILLGGSIISSCGSGGYKPSDYISTTGIAESGQETKIELEDGAAISIPYNSLDNQVAVKIERNPEKAQTLPPMDEGFVQVSDFYNFEITGGNLTGPVDLTFPINSDLIPDKSGVLVMAVPAENGWEFVPVESKDGKVTIFTDQIGDPIIAWHFSDMKVPPICDPTIAVQGIQNGDKIEVVGKVLPIRKTFFQPKEQPAAGIPITIELNREIGESGKVEMQILTTETKSDGSFNISFDASQGLKEGWNWLFVSAKCNESWWSGHVVQSEGYAEFKYTSPVVEQVSNSQPTEPPVIDQPIETPIPTGAVLLPDFIGQPIDNAIKWLESNGFKYTWVDGSSTYDLGMVYNQAPAGNQYKVPHRTVVVLYRTIKTELPTATPTPVAYTFTYSYVDCFYLKLANGTPDSVGLVPWYEQYPPSTTCSGDPRTNEMTDETIRAIYAKQDTSQGHISQLSILGKNVEAIVVSESRKDFEDPLFDFQIEEITYFDKNTGLELRSESTYTIIGCKVLEQGKDLCGNVLGKVHQIWVWELIATNYPFGE